MQVIKGYISLPVTSPSLPSSSPTAAKSPSLPSFVFPSANNPIEAPAAASTHSNSNGANNPFSPCNPSEDSQPSSVFESRIAFIAGIPSYTNVGDLYEFLAPCCHDILHLQLVLLDKDGETNNSNSTTNNNNKANTQESVAPHDSVDSYAALLYLW